jgi:hypothetical protein
MMHRRQAFVGCGKPNGIEQTPVPALTFNPPIKVNSSLKLRHALPAATTRGGKSL